MTIEAGLIAAIAALFAAFTTLGSAAFKFLIDDRRATLERIDGEWQKRYDDQGKACEERIARLESKLDASAGVIVRQAESLQKQVEVQQQAIATLEMALKRTGGAS